MSDNSKTSDDNSDQHMDDVSLGSSDDDDDSSEDSFPTDEVIEKEAKKLAKKLSKTSHLEGMSYAKFSTKLAKKLDLTDAESKRQLKKQKKSIIQPVLTNAQSNTNAPQSKSPPDLEKGMEQPISEKEDKESKWYERYDCLVKTIEFAMGLFEFFSTAKGAATLAAVIIVVAGGTGAAVAANNNNSEEASEADCSTESTLFQTCWASNSMDCYSTCPELFSGQADMQDMCSYSCCEPCAALALDAARCMGKDCSNSGSSGGSSQDCGTRFANIADPSSFSILYLAGETDGKKYSSVIDMINWLFIYPDIKGQAFTMFGPTNAALLADDSKISAFNAQGVDTKQLLKGHIAIGKYTKADIERASGCLVLDTFAGTKIKVSLKNGNLVVNDSAEAEVCDTDIVGNDGVFHGIKSYVFPLSQEPSCP